MVVLHNSNYKYLENYMTFFYEYMPHWEEDRESLETSEKNKDEKD